MASLKLNHIYKVYPNGVKAVNDFCMDIEDKEFIVFVGPSGCGKSTTLRMIAGLEEITAGELSIGDAVVNDMEPKDRDIAMVFQNYALYPHMTVYDNMAFSLKLRKMPKEEIDRRVKEAANVLGITEYLDRKPKAMSGGQRQRVALGRAIVREPKVFLLDEPLSNLDAKLRTTMRSEISKLHRKLQTTFIYVTHDQVEAMTMGTRIVVMKDGFVQQIDTPRNLYHFPCNKFVAGFIGTPQMNFFTGKLKLEKDNVYMTIDGTSFSVNVPVDYFNKVNRAYLHGEKSVIIGLRAEHMSVDPKQYPFTAKCRVSLVEELGNDCQVYGDFNYESEETLAESATKVIVKGPAGTEYKYGEVITVSMDLRQMHLFDAETEVSIAPAIPVSTVVPCTVKGGKLSFLGTNIPLPEAISAADGDYELNIPTAALSVGGDIAAEYDSEEFVDGRRLLHIHLGDRMLFVIGENRETKYNKGDKINIAVDPKLISLSKDGETVVAAIETNNTLPGKVTKQKVQTEVDGKKKKELAYKLNTCDTEIECPKTIAQRLISGGGQNVFNKELEFVFTPYQAAIAENGISAKLERVLDYGKEKFAECLIADKKVYIAVDGNIAPSDVKIELKTDEIAIIETESRIRLV